MAAVAAASVSLVAGCGTQKVVAAPGGLSVDRFNGLKACRLPKMRAVVCRPSGVRRVSIRAAANPKTLQTVQDIVATQLSVSKEQVHPGATFVDLGADSLDTVELIMALEETFSINLDEEGAQKISTVQEAADMIQITIDDAQ